MKTSHQSKKCKYWILEKKITPNLFNKN
jgi:hypothetical protein